MCGSMVDIQSPTAKIRWGKKERRRKKIEITGQKYNGLPYAIGPLSVPSVCHVCDVGVLAKQLDGSKMLLGMEVSVPALATLC